MPLPVPASPSSGVDVGPGPRQTGLPKIMSTRWARLAGWPAGTGSGRDGVVLLQARGARSAARSGSEVEEPGWFGQLQGGPDGLVLRTGGRALRDGARAGGEGDEVQPVELVVQGAPGLSGAGLGHADEQQGQPAELDVGADAV